MLARNIKTLKVITKFYTQPFYKLDISHRTMSTATSTNTTLEKVLQILNEFAPLETAESWDNVGLLVEPNEYKNIEKILLTNDFTEKVLTETLEQKANLVISYHPLIFSGLKRIVQSDWKSRIISKCFQEGIAIYSPHTSWDAAEQGVNKWLIEAISSKYDDIRPILPNAKNVNLGAGKICTLKEPITIQQAITNLKNYSGLSNVQVGLAVDSKMDALVRTVAVCAGSGASVFKNATADLFITGEMSHHDVLEATHRGSTCILMNHSNSERYFLSTFKGFLNSKLPDVAVVVSQVDTDPLKTY